MSRHIPTRHEKYVNRYHDFIRQKLREGHTTKAIHTILVNVVHYEFEKGQIIYDLINQDIKFFDMLIMKIAKEESVYPFNEAELSKLT